MGTKKERPKDADEADWVAKNWRRALCLFRNNAGLGKKVKRRMNKRFRRRGDEQITEYQANTPDTN